MITATFLSQKDTLCGFILNGHAGDRPAGESIVCAAVSSAALLAANTITEFCGCAATTEDADGFLSVRVTDGIERAVPTLLGLQLHLKELQAQYPKHIQVETTEV